MDYNIYLQQIEQYEYKQCVNDAAQYYNVPELLIYSIMKKEKGSILKDGSKLTNVNKNNTIDIGEMQINNENLKFLSKFNYSKSVLLNNRCANIYAGTFYLADGYYKFRNWTDAIVSYNIGGSTKKPKEVIAKGLVYAKDVLVTWNGLYYARYHGYPDFRVVKELNQRVMQPLKFAIN